MHTAALAAPVVQLPAQAAQQAVPPQLPGTRTLKMAGFQNLVTMCCQE